LTGTQKEQLLEFLRRHSDDFAVDSSELGQAVGVEHQIVLDTGDPPRMRPYQVPTWKALEMERQVDEMLTQGVIEPSSSPWASPVVLALKKDGSRHFCINYLALNRVTKKDQHPLPCIDDLLDQLGGARYFTSLDIWLGGYWQVCLAPEDREKALLLRPLASFNLESCP
jgi:hypothetical protein